MDAQELKEALGKDFKSHNPEVIQWEFVDKLTSTDSDSNDKLSELSNTEIICIAAHRALRKYLMTETVPGQPTDMVFAMEFQDQIIKLRPSLAGKRADAIVRILKHGGNFFAPPSQFQQAPQADMDDQPKPWWKVW